MIRDFPIATSPALADRLAHWEATGVDEREIAPARPAATVMVVRDKPRTTDAPSPVEVFMIHRVSTMAFAPDTLVFPGGGVDERDEDEDVRWAGANDVLWGGRLGCAAEDARGYVTAAVRELFEECGVLLAGQSSDGPLVDLTGDDAWRQIRADLVGRRVSLARILREHNLVLRSDLLRAEAHWITPEFEARRYDTRFFVAIMPAGQHADGETTESAASQWVDPVSTLAAYERAEVSMLPPTVTCLEHLATASSAHAFATCEPAIEQILPDLVMTDAGVVIRVTTRD